MSSLYWRPISIRVQFSVHTVLLRFNYWVLSVAEGSLFSSFYGTICWCCGVRLWYLQVIDGSNAQVTGPWTYGMYTKTMWTSNSSSDLGDLGIDSTTIERKQISRRLDTCGSLLGPVASFAPKKAGSSLTSSANIKFSCVRLFFIPLLLSLRKKRQLIASPCFLSVGFLPRFNFLARSQNCEKRLLAYLCLSVRPSVLMKQLGSYWMGFDEALYLSFFFENLSKNIQGTLNPTKITGTLYEGVSTFMTVSHWVIFGMRNVSNKSCTENQNTHTFNYFFSENFAVYEIMSKNMVEPERSQNAIWRRVACWISNVTFTQVHARARAPIPSPIHTHTHTHKYVRLIVFTRQQWFRESALMWYT